MGSEGGTEIRVKRWDCPWPGRDEQRRFCRALTHSPALQELQPLAPRRGGQGLCFPPPSAGSHGRALAVRGGCAAPHPGHATSRGQARARPRRCSGPPAAGFPGEEMAMGTGRLPLAVLPGLILLSLSLAGRCGGAAGVFTEPQVRARAGDSVLLPCLFLDPDSKGWTLHKVDWLRKAGAGTQVGRDRAGSRGARGWWQGREGEAALGRICGGLGRMEGHPCHQAMGRGSFHERKKSPRAGAGPAAPGELRSGRCIPGFSRECRAPCEQSGPGRGEKV